VLIKLKKEIKALANPEKAKLLQRFFKTGKGEYGEGDIFIGLMVPQSREIVRKYWGKLTNKETIELLHSKIHEERSIALIIMVLKFEKGGEKEKGKIYKLYLKNTKYINNWDLVDISSHRIVGAYLKNKNRKILYKLASSKSIWEKRIAIISTANFIPNNDFKDTLKISEILLNDSHDLIHKAVGWMLREVGKRSQKTEEDFLEKHYKKMSRTTLRYAIERFPEKKRRAYLNGKI
jgi:3-methyladenine DNA glycosylase AlkD